MFKPGLMVSLFVLTKMDATLNFILKAKSTVFYSNRVECFVADFPSLNSNFILFQIFGGHLNLLLKWAYFEK